MDALRKLADGKLIVQYSGADQGNALNQLLIETFPEEFSFHGCLGMIDEAIAADLPYYYINEGELDLDSDLSCIRRRIGADASCVTYESFLEMLEGDTVFEEDILDLEDIL